MIKFENIGDKSNIIGLPTSEDISDHIPAIDFVDGKNIMLEDVDDGVVHIYDCGYVKISNLIEQGIVGFDNGDGHHQGARLFNPIKFNDLR